MYPRDENATWHEVDYYECLRVGAVKKVPKEKKRSFNICKYVVRPLLW